VTINFADGTYKDYTVGRPNYKRKGVLSYRISQVILSPDEESLVFVVEKEEQDHDGVNIRYMVETVKIR
jgi:predicted secreted protein